MLICTAVWWWRLRQAKVAVVTFALLAGCMSAHAEVASIYGDGDGLCGHLTASGERFDCSAMTAAHRSLPFGTLVSVCNDGCVTVRINDRVPLFAGVTSICLQPRRGRSNSTKLAMCKCLGDTHAAAPRDSAGGRPWQGN